MNRIAWVGAVLCLGACALGQDLGKKITVDIPAAKASEVLAKLSKAAGIAMQPAGNLRNDVFVVSAHDQTVDEIMKRLAEAESGRWEHQGDLYLLVRDSSVSVAQERAELKARTDLVAKAVAKLTAKGAFDQAAAQQLAQEAHGAMDRLNSGTFRPGQELNLEKTQAKTPAARAIARILASIDPADLARIGPDQRVVFSTNPTRVQESLSGEARSAFRDFIAEQQLYRDAYRASEAPDPNNRQEFWVDGFGSPSMGEGKARLGLGLGLVIIERRFGNDLSIQIIAADPNLDTIASGNSTLQLPVAKSPNPKPLPDEKPLEIDPLAQEMANLLGGGRNGKAGAMMEAATVVTIAAKGSDDGSFTLVSPGASGQGPFKLSPELRAKLLDPEHIDPLSFVPGEAMLALARSSEKNLVALLPDPCFGPMTKDFARPVTASQLLANLSPEYGLDSKESGEWIVVSPASPFGARTNRIDRGGLGTLVRALDRNGTLRLDDVAAFAVSQNKTPSFDDLDLLYPQLINRPVADQSLSPLAYGDDSLYKFYGTLSAGQRRAVEAGQQMPFTNLSSQQIALISDLLYNSPGGPNVDLGESRPDRRQSVSSTVIATSSGSAPVMFSGGNASVKTERTIVVPNGVVGSGVLLSRASVQAKYQATNSRTGATQFVSANSLGMAKAAASSPGMDGMEQPSYDRFKSAKELTLSFRFMFSQRVMLPRSLQDHWLEGSGEGMTYDQLPEDFRKQVDQIANRMKNVFGRMRGGNQSPPPPKL